MNQPRELVAALRAHPYTKAWRVIVLHRDGHRCARCGGEDRLQVHHKEELSKAVKRLGITSLDEALSCAALFDEKNGETICRTCHRSWHASRKKGRRRP